MQPESIECIVILTNTTVIEIATSSGPKRLSELEAMTCPEVKKVVEEEKIVLTNGRELKRRRDRVKSGEKQSP